MDRGALAVKHRDNVFPSSSDVEQITAYADLDLTFAGSHKLQNSPKRQFPSSPRSFAAIASSFASNVRISAHSRAVGHSHVLQIVYRYSSLPHVVSVASIC